jgi:hypothetical protein
LASAPLPQAEPRRPRSKQMSGIRRRKATKQG